MSVAAGLDLHLDDSFARELVGLHRPWDPSPVADPSLVILNEELAGQLGLDIDALRSPGGVAVLAGNAVPAGVTTVAQAYAGHQFGGYSPQLGDGRALLLGELVGDDGTRCDLHLKGSGRTPFARGGDGRAAVGPMLREYLMGEAMHALAIPTTRALSVVATGESIVREVAGRGVQVPGAVLARVASSHLRVGTFQFASATGDRQLLQRLAAYAIARHVPSAADTDHPALSLYDHVVEVQAELVAQWMAVGFIHGVMNTDNTTISGDTIDYGPCAFMDAYDPATVFSSIDHGGRYAYGNQPAIVTWNLARLAEAMLPLFDDDGDRAIEMATGVLETFPVRFQAAYSIAMRTKLGLAADAPAGDALVADLLALMHEQRVDYTSCLRSLSSAVRGDAAKTRALFAEPESFGAWHERWAALLGDDRAAIADAMDRVNPIYIPRNHVVEEVLTAASWGDIPAFEKLLDVVTHPFDERVGFERYAQPAPTDQAETYRTFCGT
ncbi:MAG TPA: YdiU family protein [Ilumatobacteraceae bacterium]|nr:YdiU family protein [Ilumatobacteraceae bacterium]